MLVLAGLLLALVVLTVLVAAGSLTRIDQFSVDHLMPWLRPGSQRPGGSAGFYRPFTLHTSTWSKLFDLWTYPCSILISSLVVIWAAIVLWRRYGPVVALAPAVAWVIGNGIEVIGKGTITRPPLYREADGIPVHIDAFDDSFPSGHMMRGVIVAFAIGAHVHALVEVGGALGRSRGARARAPVGAHGHGCRRRSARRLHPARGDAVAPQDRGAR